MSFKKTAVAICYAVLFLAGQGWAAHFKINGQSLTVYDTYDNTKTIQYTIGLKVTEYVQAVLVTAGGILGVGTNGTLPIRDRVVTISEADGNKGVEFGNDMENPLSYNVCIYTKAGGVVVKIGAGITPDNWTEKMVLQSGEQDGGKIMKFDYAFSVLIKWLLCSGGIATTYAPLIKSEQGDFEINVSFW